MKLALWTTLFSIPATTAMATEDNLVSTIIYSVIGVLFALYHLFDKKISEINPRLVFRGVLIGLSTCTILVPAAVNYLGWDSMYGYAVAVLSMWFIDKLQPLLEKKVTGFVKNNNSDK
jgi:hypothetical protein